MLGHTILLLSEDTTQRTMLLGLLYTLCVISAQVQGGHPEHHEVDAELGSTISLPCEAMVGVDGDFFYRSWSRGELSRLHKNATKLFFQIPGSNPEPAPGARSDMSVDETFNLTITNVQKEDTSAFTCYVYKTQKFIYSYAYVFVKSEDSINLPVNNTALIAGLTSGVVLLALLVTAIAIYRKKTSGGMTRLSGLESTEDLLMVRPTDRSNLKVNIEVKENQNQHKAKGKYGKKKRKTGGKRTETKNKAE